HPGNVRTPHPTRDRVDPAECATTRSSGRLEGPSDLLDRAPALPIGRIAGPNALPVNGWPDAGCGGEPEARRGTRGWAGGMRRVAGASGRPCGEVRGERKTMRR